MKNLRRLIRRILEEQFLLEMGITPTEPEAFQRFDLGSETQFGFKTKNGNIY